MSTLQHVPEYVTHMNHFLGLIHWKGLFTFDFEQERFKHVKGILSFKTLDHFAISLSPTFLTLSLFVYPKMWLSSCQNLILIKRNKRQWVQISNAKFSEQDGMFVNWHFSGRALFNQVEVKFVQQVSHPLPMVYV